MADKIFKFLKVLSKKERLMVEDLIYKICILKDLTNLDIKKMQGYKDLFRCRKGDIRIVFKKDNVMNSVTSIDRRDDNTYRDF